MSIQLLTVDTLQNTEDTRTVGSALSPYGFVFVELVDKIIVSINFHEAASHSVNQYASLPIRKDNQRIANIVEAIFSSEAKKYCYQAKGTSFQILVWQQLLTIPVGNTCTYVDIAKGINRPHASRAVGNAIAKNPLAVIIPCHRVLPKNGGIGGYRWGRATKHALLMTEQKENA